jgi:hypothetical protein
MSSSVNVLKDLVTAPRVRWAAVERRLKTHPNEAREFLFDSYHHNHDVSTGRNANASTILYHVLCRNAENYPPVSVVRILIRCYPEALWIGWKDDKSPLHAACRRRAKYETLSLIMDGRPSVRSDGTALLAFWRSYSELFGGDSELVRFCREAQDLEASSIVVRLYHLLHYCTSPPRACKPNECLPMVAASSCDSPVDFLSVSDGFHEWTRHHDGSCHTAWHAVNAAATFGPVGLLELFIDHQPLNTCIDDNGWSALHCLASSGGTKGTDLERHHRSHQHHYNVACVRKLQLLLSASPSLSRVSDHCQRLPIHVAAASGFPTEGLRILLESWHGSLLCRDGKDHLFPALIAAASEDAPLDSVFILLLACPQIILPAQRMAMRQ